MPTKLLAPPDPRKDIVRVLYCQGVAPLEISRQTGVKRDTIYAWVGRQKWKKNPTATREALDKLAPITITPDTQDPRRKLSDDIRTALSEELKQQIEALRKEPILSAKELGNAAGTQGRASVLKTLTDAAEQICDWKSEKSQTCAIIALPVMSGQSQSPKGVIDVVAQAPHFSAEEKCDAPKALPDNENPQSP